jgi:CBS domain-containing protein
MDCLIVMVRGELMSNDLYSSVTEYRKVHIKEAASDHFQLNQLHDQMVQQVIIIALEQVSIQYGPPPCLFTFFVMGSAGRFEQSIWSDQDHGIIYLEQNDEVKAYFLRLGKEISKGLFQAGYPYCDGGVMASNPFWCKSINEWQQQLTKWILESSWESIRYLLIFLDGRTLYGEVTYVDTLKKHIYETNHGKLVSKALSNTLHLKKGTNVLGKLLVETHGPHARSLNIKEIGLFPYVNAIRLFSIKEKMLETSTLLRLNKIPESWFPASDKQLYEQQFLRLLNYRLLFGDHTNYDSGHYLAINRLTKEQVKEVKEILKNGAALFNNVRKLLEKEGLYENE